MITKVNAKNFKGLEFNQEIGAKTLIIGPNGAGKSARVQALALAVNGYIPGTEKTNPAIHAAFATEDKLFIGFEIDKTSFTRRFSKDGDGRVRQDYLVDRKKAGKTDFEKRMAAAGNPKVLDLSAFLSLSDQKKIDYIFNLYPPAGDVAGLRNKIESAKEKLNKKTADLSNAEKFVQQSSTMRADSKLPSGTLAEVSAEIQKLEKEYQAAQEALRQAEIDAARQEARANAKQEAAALSSPPAPQPSDSPAARGEAAGSTPIPQPGGPAVSFPSNGNAIKSIQAIIEAIKSVNCPVCATGAAMMVCRRELKKYQKETSL